MREDCPNKDRCGKTGHYLKEGVGWIRCECLQEDLRKRELGIFYCDEPMKNTPMIGVMEKNCVIEGSLTTLRKHVSGVMLKAQEQKKSVRVMDAYRLMDIFLEKDQEYKSTSESTDVDLLILLLGFGDPRNRYLPELIVQVLQRRALLALPNWVILGIEQSQVAGKYSSDLASILSTFRKVGSK